MRRAKSTNDPGDSTEVVLTKWREAWGNVQSGRRRAVGLIVAGVARRSSSARRVPIRLARPDDHDTNIAKLTRPMLLLLEEQLGSLEERMALLDDELAGRAQEDAEAKRLMTVPEIGPTTTTVLVALAPRPQTFKRRRDFAAWLELTPAAALHRRKAEARRDIPQGRTEPCTDC